MPRTENETVEPEVTFTCIARCKVCGDELNRAEGVPENEKMLIIISAPLVAVCPKPDHSTFSDCNIGVVLEWFEERDGELVAVKKEEDDG